MRIDAYQPDGLMSCSACDGVHRIVSVPAGGKALCARCDTLLFRNIPKSLDRTAALYLAALILFLIANFSPFLSLRLGGRVEESWLISGGLHLLKAGMLEIGLLVLLTSVVFPFLVICGMLYLLLPLKLSIRPPGTAIVWRFVRAITPWSLMGVFLLGLLVSIIKLQDLAVIIPGLGFFAFIGLLTVTTAAIVSFDPGVLWKRIGPDHRSVNGSPAGQTAAQLGYASCEVCQLLLPETGVSAGFSCPRCGSTMHGPRHGNSLSRTWAYLTTASLLLVPANLFPVMTVVRFGQRENSTILAGVLHLIQDGAWPLGLLVFFASIMVPITKLASLMFLLVMVQRKSDWRRRDRTVLYRVTEALGAWSMVDIYLISILLALLRMEELAAIYPGLGATFFGVAIVMTMMAAHSFDQRMIWDQGAHYD